MKIIICANGELSAPDHLDSLLEEADLLIAADGGTRYLAKMGRMPDVVIGDMDSIQDEQQSRLKVAGIEMLVFSSDKDQSDLELALLHAKERGADEIHVLAGLGRRWDHSLVNLLLAALPELAQVEVNFWHGVQRLVLIKDHLELSQVAGTRLSLIPVGGDAQGVSTQGLSYALEDEDLLFGSSRGVSNEFAEQKASINVKKGMLLAVISPADYD